MVALDVPVAVGMERALKRRGPREIVVALPVAPPGTVAELAEEADRIVCLSKPPRFLALGYHYRDFPQLADEEVVNALRRAATHERGPVAVSHSDPVGTLKQT